MTMQNAAIYRKAPYRSKNASNHTVATWTAIGSTWALSLIAAVWAGGQHFGSTVRDSQSIDNHERRIRVVENAVTEMRTDIAWIRHMLEGSND